MSKIILVGLLSFLSGSALAQDYFVFIGSDNRQPFYVRIDSQLYSSSPEGHLLVAPLKDSNYTLTIGFPGDHYPEQRYALSVRGRDREFALRRQDDGGWRLYDELAKNWVTAEEKESRGLVGSSGIRKDDAFSRMMAGVVHDTAVLYNTYAMEQVLKDSPAVAVPRPTPDNPAVAVTRMAPDSPTVVGSRHRDTSAVFPTRAIADTSAVIGSRHRDTTAVLSTRAVADTPAVVRADTVHAGPRARSVPDVVKLSEKRSARSLRLVYADRKDTVVVIIPRDTVAAAKNDIARVHDSARVRSQAADTSMNRLATRNLPPTGTQPSTGNRPPDAAGSPLTDTSRQNAKVIPYINSDCHNFATEYDVDRLRVKMLQTTRDEDRITAARKVFKTKCFYTPQVRALSEVFASDAGKFLFFQAAWPFAADEHFHELSALLTDPVYISRFKAMTGQP